MPDLRGIDDDHWQARPHETGRDDGLKPAGRLNPDMAYREGREASSERLDPRSVTRHMKIFA
jgi:hypothetical protein